MCAVHACACGPVTLGRDMPLLTSNCNVSVCTPQPWVPLDMDMEREFRNKIFEKAGTRESPFLFVDDEFIGGYDKLVELNEQDLLDDLINY